MNRLILLKVHKIVLSISIRKKNKRFLNPTMFLKQEINGVKT